MDTFPWITEERAFIYLKTRWDKIQKDGFEAAGIDLALYPIIPMFNRIPGVVTFMSCASHPHEGAEFLWTKMAKRLGEYFYISFGVTKEGAHHLCSFFNLLQDTLDQMSLDNSVPVSKWFRKPGTLSLVMHQQVEDPSNSSVDQPHWKGFRLAAKLDRKDPSVQNYFLTVLTQTLIHYLAYYLE